MKIGNFHTENGLFVILGPCVIEGEKFTMDIALEIKKICEDVNIPFIFKASFDKANRSSIGSYRGPGIGEGLRILTRVRDEINIPVLSDIHEPWQAEEVKDILSVVQVPAFLSRQTNLLLSAGRTGLIVNVKKSQMMSAKDMINVVDKIRSTGNDRIMLTERGTFFGYGNLVVDFKNIAIMKKTGCPVIIDATHAVQKPSSEGNISGGEPEFIPLIASAGVVSGADGVFLEVHPEPEKALSDGTNSLNIKNLKPLLINLKKLYNL